MSLLLNEISFFQFDNLIRNRIPFLLLNLTEETPRLYSQALYQKHLEAMENKTNKTQALALLSQKSYPKHEAILVLCQNGNQSCELATSLEKDGYLNVFFVKGGLETLKADASR